MKIKPVIVIHGGAGNYRGLSEDIISNRLKHLEKAVLLGYEKLSSSALDAVEAAVSYMESCGFFNAGLGSVLTINGSVEMDAGIMDGRDLRVGATALLKRVKNPISLARKIMEETDHIFIAGEWAEKLAEFYGLGFSDEIINEYKVKRFKEIYDNWIKGEIGRMSKLRSMIQSLGKLFDGHDTVGAVALDFNGNVASAVSTGGYWLKFPGRIGDVPLVGCGFYADNDAGAAAATGTGEYIARLNLSRVCCELMRSGFSAQEACSLSIKRITDRFGSGNAGIIAVDKNGNFGFDFNTNGMSRAIMHEDLDKPIVGIFRE
ncbi:MAG: isoaspartyl peptidase/L-asparaginase [Candidatus Methanomethylicia archaeon]